MRPSRTLDLILGETHINASTGMDATRSGFSLNASSRRRCVMACIARSVPQPGHLSPVRAKNGHFGNARISEGFQKYRNRRTATPMPTISNRRTVGAMPESPVVFTMSGPWRKQPYGPARDLRGRLGKKAIRHVSGLRVFGYSAAAAPMQMTYIRPPRRPTIKLAMIQPCAVLDADLAPSMSPNASLVLTWEA